MRESEYCANLALAQQVTQRARARRVRRDVKMLAALYVVVMGAVTLIASFPHW